MIDAEHVTVAPGTEELSPGEKLTGLYHKYFVARTDGKPIGGPCFVLTPTKDFASRAAIARYAEEVALSHPQLRDDLIAQYELGDLVTPVHGSLEQTLDALARARPYVAAIVGLKPALSKSVTDGPVNKAEQVLQFLDDTTEMLRGRGDRIVVLENLLTNERALVTLLLETLERVDTSAIPDEALRMAGIDDHRLAAARAELVDQGYVKPAAPAAQEAGDGEG